MIISIIVVVVVTIIIIIITIIIIFYACETKFMGMAGCLQARTA